jgi:plastocyanin
MLTRRGFLSAGGLALAGLAAPGVARSAPVVEIRMRSDEHGAHAWFDPVGVLIRPGQTVRWIMDSPGNPHTATAYHPNNAKHSLRIPETATPWDSGFLLNPGDRFELQLVAEGVYDYFCLPHEAAGMVGRIIVGRPGGPGALSVDYFVGRPGTAEWLRVPPDAARAFPSVPAIMAQKVVRHRELSLRRPERGR